jgi:transposase InsO family protein
LGNLKAAKKPVGTFKAYEPGFLHIDSTYLPSINGQTRFVFVAIDRATRLAFIGVYDARNAANALDFFTQACRFFPFKIHKVLTDNGAEFTNKSFRRWPGSKTKLHPFERLLQDLQISHRFTKPYTPQTNGLVERFNRTLKDATLHKGRYDSHLNLEQDVRDWIRIYNDLRRHTGIQRRTPVQEAARWYILKPELFTRDPDLLKSAAFATLRD